MGLVNCCCFGWFGEVWVLLICGCLVSLFVRFGFVVCDVCVLLWFVFDVA